MTIRQKASLAALLDNLESVARELAAAPEATRANGERYAQREGMTPHNGAAHQAGALEQICASRATEIRALLSLARQTFPSVTRKAA